MRALFLLALAGAQQHEQCGGARVTRDLQFGIPASDWRMADHICCHNTRGAEPRGYLDGLALFDALNRTGETTFYDSVCGLPLFVAPRNRTMADFRDESRRHGWPSFRDEELVAENVRVLRGTNGEVVSVDGTHLGHNLPDARNRYCINLCSVAGAPPPRPGRARAGT